MIHCLIYFLNNLQVYILFFRLLWRHISCLFLLQIKLKFFNLSFQAFKFNFQLKLMYRLQTWLYFICITKSLKDCIKSILFSHRIKHLVFHRLIIISLLWPENCNFLVTRHKITSPIKRKQLFKSSGFLNCISFCCSKKIINQIMLAFLCWNIFSQVILALKCVNTSMSFSKKFLEL